MDGGGGFRGLWEEDNLEKCVRLFLLQGRARIWNPVASSHSPLLTTTNYEHRTFRQRRKCNFTSVILERLEWNHSRQEMDFPTYSFSLPILKAFSLGVENCSTSSQFAIRLVNVHVSPLAKMCLLEPVSHGIE